MHLISLTTATLLFAYKYACLYKLNDIEFIDFENKYRAIIIATMVKEQGTTF